MNSSTTLSNTYGRNNTATAFLLALSFFPSFSSQSASAILQERSAPALTLNNTNDIKPPLLGNSNLQYHYNLPPAGPNIAKYTFDELGRIASADFPNGLKISNTSYMGSTDVLLAFTKQENGFTTKYRRETHGGVVNLGWEYSRESSNQGKEIGQIVADICFTRSGGYAFRIFNNNTNSYHQINKSNGEICQALISPDQSIIEIDDQKRPIQLLRPNGTKVVIEYATTNSTKIVGTTIESQKNPLTIRNFDINDNEIRWDYKNNLWECSLSDVLASSNCPLVIAENLSGTSLMPILYAHKDGSSVAIASNGDRSIFFPDHRVATYDAHGKLRIVQRGMSSRTFIYNFDTLVAIEDRYGSHTSSIRLPNEYGEHKADPSGNVLLNGNIIYIQSKLETFHLIPQTIANRRVFPILGRIRNLAGRCPGNARLTNGGVELVKGEFPIFLPADIKLGEVRRVEPVKIIDSCDLSELEKRDGGTYKPIVQFIRTWADLATDEKIEGVTDPNLLKQLNVLMKDEILSNEIRRGMNADYLIWLRDAIKTGKLPFALEIKYLNTYEVGNFQGSNFGGVTLYSKTPGTDGFNLVVNLNRQNYAPNNLSKIYQSMINGGGLGLYASRETDFFVSFFHESQHAYAYRHGISYSGSPEPPAHFGAFSALALISPEEAQSLNFLSNGSNK